MSVATDLSVATTSVIVSLPLAVVLIGCVVGLIVACGFVVMLMRLPALERRVNGLTRAQELADSQNVHFEQKLNSIQTELRGQTDLLHVIIKGHLNAQ